MTAKAYRWSGVAKFADALAAGQFARDKIKVFVKEFPELVARYGDNLDILQKVNVIVETNPQTLARMESNGVNATWGIGFDVMSDEVNQLVKFSDLVPASGKVNIRVHPRLLENETATVAVIFHEFHEIAQMEKLMGNGKMTKAHILDYLDSIPVRPGEAARGGAYHREAAAFESLLAGWLKISNDVL